MMMMMMDFKGIWLGFEMEQNGFLYFYRYDDGGKLLLLTRKLDASTM